MKDNAMQIAFILDRSGSMGKIAAGTVEGVNAFLAEQKNATTETSIRFVQFDNEYEDVYNGKIDQAPLLTLSRICVTSHPLVRRWAVKSGSN